MTTIIQEAYLAQSKAIRTAYDVSDNALWAAYRADRTAALAKCNAQKDINYKAYMKALIDLRQSALASSNNLPTTPSAAETEKGEGVV